MLQRSYRLSERIIVHNEAGKDVLVRQFRQQANRVSVIPHGLYLNASEGDTYPAFECLRLLAFGSIRENKGLHLAIRAVQTLPPDFHIPVHLTIAGGIQNSSAERYWQTCKQMIATKPDGIEVIEGHVDDDKIGPLLARHHAVLLPYTDFYSESGVANLALSHQRPILATAAGGLGKLVESGVCGVPIATPSAESVAQAIVVALELGRERLRQMGIEGSEFMQRTRSWDSIARQTAELYAQLSMDQTVLEHGSRAPVQSWTDNTTKTKEYI
jgi:glycosyltransferase involved in cell wall biosynthesis